MKSGLKTAGVTNLMKRWKCEFAQSLDGNLYKIAIDLYSVVEHMLTNSSEDDISFLIDGKYYP